MKKMTYENCIKPIVEILTLLGVATALFFQNKTIQEQKEEFKKQKIKDDIQQFESVFFSLLNEYNLLVEGYGGLCNIKIKKQTFLDLLDNEFKNIEIEGSTREFSEILRIENYQNTIKLPVSISDEIFPNTNTPLFDTYGLMYFKFLKCIFEYIDNVNIFNSSVLNIKFRKVYFKILMSKIGVYENYYIFFYALSKHGTFFKEIIEKYSLFENIKIEKCMFPLKRNFNVSAFIQNHS